MERRERERELVEAGGAEIVLQFFLSAHFWQIRFLPCFRPSKASKSGGSLAKNAEKTAQQKLHGEETRAVSKIPVCESEQIEKEDGCLITAGTHNTL